MTYMRQPTLGTLGFEGFEGVLNIFEKGQLPTTASDMVAQVFGEESGCLLISGVNGIVGSGKAIQLSRLLVDHGVSIVGLDFPSSRNGISEQWGGLVNALGERRAREVVSNITRLTYGGKNLPTMLRAMKPGVAIECLPEVLEVKREHYAMLREAFPGIGIHSVTSGILSSKLGAGIAHPAFPHPINKVWEIINDDLTFAQLLWSLGMVPMPMEDRWSFVLDVLFCGLTKVVLDYSEMTNMPPCKVDKYVRACLGPNPCRAHDAIGVPGANILTQSCLHHLTQEYGPLFTPPQVLGEKIDSGETWYPPNHQRPIVDWLVDMDEFSPWILGPLFWMTSLILHEERAHPTIVNSIGELCAQFRSGILSVARNLGSDRVVETVERYQFDLYPQSCEGGAGCWYPEVFDQMEEHSWQQLYVNAEHNGEIGVISISREALNWDVIRELNRAIDWLLEAGIRKVILTSDFHLSTQMVGADPADLYGVLHDFDAAKALIREWSLTAMRLPREFEVSVAVIPGKRCWGGFLELFLSCDFVLSVDTAQLAFPEVKLPVVPGMGGCDLPFRRTAQENWPKITRMLLTGDPIRAKDAVGWLIDFSGPIEEVIGKAWGIVNSTETLPLRKLETAALSPLPTLPHNLPPGNDAARKEVWNTIHGTCCVKLGDVLDRRAGLVATFICGKQCSKGQIGKLKKVMTS